MSCSLYWRPIKRGAQVGNHQLRDAIRHRFGSKAILDENALDFLQGLSAASVEGAAELIAAIEKHDEIETYLEC